MGALFDRSARVSTGLSIIAILSIITMGLPSVVFTNSTQTLGNTFDLFSKMILSIGLTRKLDTPTEKSQAYEITEKSNVKQGKSQVISPASPASPTQKSINSSTAHSTTDHVAL